jgi:hypothetical protein
VRYQARRQPLAQAFPGLAGKDRVVSPRAELRDDAQPATPGVVMDEDSRHRWVIGDDRRVSRRREDVDLGPGELFLQKGE